MHKKFIKRDGKTFGPYYYTSYREDGKVKTKYFGSNGQNIAGSSDALYKLFLLLAIITLFIVVFPIIEKILTALIIGGIQETPLISFISPPTPENISNLTGNYIPVLIEVNGTDYKNYSYYLYNDSGLVSTDKYYSEDRGVSVGGHICILLNNRSIICRGLPTLDERLYPYNKGDAVGIAVGQYHACFLLDNGNITCQGDPTYGQANNYIQGDAIGVSAGSYHTCALLNTGNVTCWGAVSGHDSGQAANYTQGNAIGVSAGGSSGVNGHTCALLNTGNVTCWGQNSSGQANNYTQGDAIGVSAGAEHTCILLKNENITCWGANSFGQSANYTQGNAIGVSAGNYHTCALLNTGNVICWGQNGYNQSENYTQGNAIGVSAGNFHTCALLNTGNITCWGYWDPGWGSDNYTQGDAKKQSFYVFQFLNPGTYYLDATACDTANNCGSSETRTIFISALVCGDNITSDTNLTGDLLNCPRDGLIIGNNGITLDCQGHLITGSGSNYEGINNTGFNNTIIKNCNLQSFKEGIYLEYSNSNILANNTVSSNTNGIWLEYSSYNNLINNTANSNSRGVYIRAFSSYNNLTNNNASSNNNAGIFLESSANYNNVINNTASSNSIGIRLESSANYNNVINNTASLNNAGIYLSLSSNYNLLINNSAVNNNEGIMVWQSSSYNNLTNNNASSNVYGIHIESSANYNNVVNNIASFNSYGVYQFSSSNSFINNTLNSNSNDGIRIRYSSNNILINNSANSNTNGIYFEVSSYSNLTNNNAMNNSDWDVVSSSSSDNIFINQTIAGAGFSYPTTATFTYAGDISIKGIASPPSNQAGLSNISRYLNITNSSSANVLMNISYSNIPLWMNESLLKLYKYNGTGWILANTSSSLNGVDTLNKIVYANIGSFSIFAPMGQQILAYCGDGIINNGEQCDDGNTVSGDGCSAICQNETCAEITNQAICPTIDSCTWVAGGECVVWNPGNTCSYGCGPQQDCCNTWIPYGCQWDGAWCTGSVNCALISNSGTCNGALGACQWQDLSYCTTCADNDGDGYLGTPSGCGSDCNDSNISIYPGATEVCNGADDNCINGIDEGLGTTTCGQGACNHTIANCVAGQTQTCNPMQGAITEVCGNGIDDDCDGSIDEGCVTPPPSGGGGCKANWNCTAWSDCINGQQTRLCTCTCLNPKDCGGDNNQTRSCSMPPAPPTCTDECSIGKGAECINNSAYRTCGNYDSDSCLEWQDKLCGAGESCDYTSGKCKISEKAAPAKGISIYWKAALGAAVAIVAIIIIRDLIILKRKKPAVYTRKLKIKKNVEFPEIILKGKKISKTHKIKHS